MERLSKEAFMLSHQLYKGILILKHSNGETCYMLILIRNKNHSNYSSGAQSKIRCHALNSCVLLTFKKNQLIGLTIDSCQGRKKRKCFLMLLDWIHITTLYNTWLNFHVLVNKMSKLHTTLWRWNYISAMLSLLNQWGHHFTLKQPKPVTGRYPNFPELQLILVFRMIPQPATPP